MNFLCHVSLLFFQFSILRRGHRSDTIVSDNSCTRLEFPSLRFSRVLGAAHAKVCLLCFWIFQPNLTWKISNGWLAMRKKFRSNLRSRAVHEIASQLLSSRSGRSFSSVKRHRRRLLRGTIFIPRVEFPVFHLQVNLTFSSSSLQGTRSCSAYV